MMRVPIPRDWKTLKGDEAWRLLSELVDQGTVTFEQRLGGMFLYKVTFISRDGKMPTLECEGHYKDQALQGIKAYLDATKLPDLPDYKVGDQFRADYFDAGFWYEVTKIWSPYKVEVIPARGKSVTTEWNFESNPNLTYEWRRPSFTEVPRKTVPRYPGKTTVYDSVL
jgi:hypothetical protein